MGMLFNTMCGQLASVDASEREALIVAAGENVKRGVLSGKNANTSARRYVAKIVLKAMVATARPGELERLNSLITAMDDLERKGKGAKKK
jgi:hypothetical protein